MWLHAAWNFILANQYFSFFASIGNSRYPYHENSSSDSEEEILRRLKLQQSISLHSGQISSKYGGLNSPLNQPINLDGFHSIQFDQNNLITSPTSSIRHPFHLKHSSSRTSSYYRNNHNHQNRDLLGQAERGKIGSNSSSECSSIECSSIEASVDSSMGLINHEKKGEDFDVLFFSSWKCHTNTNWTNLQIVGKSIRY